MEYSAPRCIAVDESAAVAFTADVAGAACIECASIDAVKGWSSAERVRFVLACS